MRPNTKVCFLLESVGRPEHTREAEDSLAVVIRTMASWLLEVPMGHKVRITLARSPEELRDRRSAANQELLGELESLLNNQGDEGRETIHPSEIN